MGSIRIDHRKDDIFKFYLKKLIKKNILSSQDISKALGVCPTYINNMLNSCKNRRHKLPGYYVKPIIKILQLGETERNIFLDMYKDCYPREII